MVFWSAPNPTQEKFWRTMAQEYMKDHPGVQVDVSPMPESPSSEAGILTALASGTKLTASENVFVGFGAQLVKSQAIVPLDTLQGYSDLIRSRKAEQLVAGWKFPDGHQYILPLYSNAMLYAWRMDILKQLGYQEPPRTYGEILALGQKLKSKYPDKYVLARKVLVDPNSWWERWFDFFTLYDAASDGAPFLNGTEVVADRAAVTKVMSFYKELDDKGYLLTKDATDPFETGLAVWNVVGPWTLPYWKEKYPELKVGDNVVLTPPPVPDDFPAGKTPKTFADSKGVVIYRNASPAEQQAAWEFIKWVLSDPRHDLTWLEMTGLPPARGDLTTDPVFRQYLAQNPGLAQYAGAVPTGVPPIQNEKFADLYTLMGERLMVPVLTGRKSPALAFDDMKAAWAEVLKR
ncbi:MAG: extracellular solute-binding protein [Bacillota bacterium]|nr:extracellular solute-binding protein [Bacillota bacterium]